MITQRHYNHGSLFNYINDGTSNDFSTEQVLLLFKPLMHFLASLHEIHFRALLNLSPIKTLISKISDTKPIYPTELVFNDVSASTSLLECDSTCFDHMKDHSKFDRYRVPPEVIEALGQKKIKLIKGDKVDVF